IEHGIVGHLYTYLVCGAKHWVIGRCRVVELELGEVDEAAHRRRKKEGGLQLGEAGISCEQAGGDGKGDAVLRFERCRGAAVMCHCRLLPADAYLHTLNLLNVKAG